MCHNVALFTCVDCHGLFYFVSGQGGYGYLKEWLWWAGMILSKYKDLVPHLLCLWANHHNIHYQKSKHQVSIN